MKGFTLFERLKINWTMSRIIKDPRDTQMVFKFFSIFLNGKDQALAQLHVRRAFIKTQVEDDYSERYFAKPYMEKLMSQTYPVGSLGAVAQEYFVDNNLDVGFYPEIYNEKPFDHTYLMQRAYEAHDLWHALLGLGTEPIDEMAVLSFTAGQLNDPLAFNVAIAALLHCVQEDPQWDTSIIDLMMEAYKLGRDCGSLLKARPEQSLNESVEVVRERLGLPAAGISVPEFPADALVGRKKINEDRSPLKSPGKPEISV